MEVVLMETVPRERGLRMVWKKLEPPCQETSVVGLVGERYSVRRISFWAWKPRATEASRVDGGE